MRTLRTAREIVFELGGYRAVADRIGVTYEAVCGWVKMNNFPPRTYVSLLDALADRNKTAPYSLWRMVEPPDRNSVETQP